jgi:hypothetical protein
MEVAWRGGGGAVNGMDWRKFEVVNRNVRSDGEQQRDTNCGMVVLCTRSFDLLACSGHQSLRGAVVGLG